LHNEHGQPAYTLEFRSSKDIGANAFALPGGTIIVTDQLVTLAGNDEEILAVLAHELGHVSERHPLRQLLQSSVAGLAMTWYLGDISTLLAAAPTLLLQSSYSRDFERRADRYAADMLRHNGIAPARLADMLGKLESSHPAEKAGKGQASRIAEFFSSHPDTEERIRTLRDTYSLP
jgi:Zn-dependent protease with chaperone function